MRDKIRDFFQCRQMDARLARIEYQLDIILRVIKRGQVMAQADIDRLKVSVQKNTDATEAGSVLIRGLAQQIRDAADDPEQLRALADKVEADAAALSAAITENTPSAPPA